MCNFENGFVLCTCQNEATELVHNKNSRRYKNSPKIQIKGYRWFLLRFIDTFEPMMEGQYEPPSKEIGAGLTAEWVLLHLNFENCFDFDYTPQEGDNLMIYAENPQKYMSFIFRQSEWICDRYDRFSTMLELRLEGEIKPLPTDPVV